MRNIYIFNPNLIIEKYCMSKKIDTKEFNKKFNCWIKINNKKINRNKKIINTRNIKNIQKADNIKSIIFQFMNIYNNL